MKTDNKVTCMDILIEFLKKNKQWHKKVELYSIAEGWSPETIGRNLRFLHEGFTLHGKYYQIKRDWYIGKNRGMKLAMYKL